MRMIASLEDPADLQMVRTNSVRAEVVAERATEGAHALKVEYLPAEWPNVTLVPAKPWDWTGFGGLALDITNPGSVPVEFGVRVDDDRTANGAVHSRQGMGTVPAGKTGHFVLPVGVNPMDLGMRGVPTALPGLTSLSGGGGNPFSLDHIVALQVFLHNPAAPTTLYIDNIRLVQLTPPMDGIVDRWGQYAKADWPGKLHSEIEFTARRKAEDTELAQHPTLPDRDRFGGWESGPKQQATGFFRTEKVDGKWWFVDPDGHLFFSLGMDCVVDQGQTFATGRERMFSWLPDSTGEFGHCWSHVTGIHSGPVKEGEAFDFLAANLQRKYATAPGTEVPGYREHEVPRGLDSGVRRTSGKRSQVTSVPGGRLPGGPTDPYGKWLDVSLKRLPAWGFNTIANWSDWRLYRNGRVPYVATAGISGNHARVASGEDYWGKMHDPFDPQFAADVRESLRPVAGRVKDDPWCLGWFVDNEISWGGEGNDQARCGLALGALALPAESSPAKRAILAQLKQEYEEIGKLNAAWNGHWADWSSLEGPVKISPPFTEPQRKDLLAFVSAFADTYFRTIRDELKRIDPHHLCLGCRFAGYTQEAAESAARFCDVVSFNIYQPQLDSARATFFAALGKPCIIGEFHFGALDRGMFHTGLVATASQKERAETYIKYVRSVLDSPSFVGCHWFQYHDEPLTGRTYDGENYNIGFVTVTDTPYPEMVAAAQQVHAESYLRRARKR